MARSHVMYELPCRLAAFTSDSITLSIHTYTTHIQRYNDRRAVLIRSLNSMCARCIYKHFADHVFSNHAAPLLTQITNFGRRNVHVCLKGTEPTTAFNLQVRLLGRTLPMDEHIQMHVSHERSSYVFPVIFSSILAFCQFVFTSFTTFWFVFTGLETSRGGGRSASSNHGFTS